MAEILGVSVAWLYGETDIKLTPSSTPLTLTSVERELLSLIRRVSANQLGRVRGYLEAIAGMASEAGVTGGVAVATRAAVTARPSRGGDPLREI